MTTPTIGKPLRKLTYRYTREDVNTRRLGIYGSGERVPTVNVKIHYLSGVNEAVMAKFSCTEAEAEKAVGYAIESECEDFWRYWSGDEDSDALDHYWPVRLYGTITVESAGRSSGWLVVRGLPELSAWNAITLGHWRRFENAVREDVKYRCSVECLIELIEANDWAQPIQD